MSENKAPLIFLYADYYTNPLDVIAELGVSSGLTGIAPPPSSLGEEQPSVQPSAALFLAALTADRDASLQVVKKRRRLEVWARSCETACFNPYGSRGSVSIFTMLAPEPAKDLANCICGCHASDIGEAPKSDLEAPRTSRPDLT
ncbi:hypothetical protein AJ78_02378 [Emergomyces pasteurianus Ep9510]|uniref:Uncharacterized protein n=1 Tax=Emergomyces pasteurianus Ep9510 TaxID=1447872 RepID=A0A1J9QQH9_9EURO|nr:hypothetical protein AJ78_02378 [Emergomyces pasteurianus Ep9510]